MNTKGGTVYTIKKYYTLIKICDRNFVKQLLQKIHAIEWWTIECSGSLKKMENVIVYSGWLSRERYGQSGFIVLFVCLVIQYTNVCPIKARWDTRLHTDKCRSEAKTKHFIVYSEGLFRE